MSSLSLVAPPTLPERNPETEDGVVVTRHIDGRYLVANVRDNGTTYAATFYTRKRLEQLGAAIACELLATP